MTKTTNEKVAMYDKKILQYQNKKKQLIQKNKVDERKARTKRLIERGAILESLIDGAEELANDQITIILKKTVGSSYGKDIITQTKSKVDNTTVSGEETLPPEES